MDSRGSRRRRAGPLGPLALRALAALPDKGPRVRGCPRGGRASLLPSRLYGCPSFLAHPEARPPSSRNRTSSSGCMGPTGLILPRGPNPDPDSVPGRPPPPLLLFCGPGELLVSHYTWFQHQLLGLPPGTGKAGSSNLASGRGTLSPPPRLDSGQRNPKSSCCLQSIPAALGFRSLLSCLSSVLVQIAWSSP